ncbi:G8 domain-containing [Chlorella sorokiniana]|uniref:phosphopantothenoylcysteine decarboxylase n=1 Tax=Chlorella sorokiniana TaxID=3076 RepID=A0A2P6TJW4_CHLSO|nr:G8 domain-containing [Chlorella sorokiniana]|eukprot:PRW44355.1 G8 domain-containing [Chlorella sorokiniana]
MGGRLALPLLAALLLPLAVRAELISNSTLSETQCTGDEAEGTYCFVAESTFPRSCSCVRNVCPSASISETTNCFICDRGYGIYTSEEECMANEAVVEAVGIDPSSYPIPAFPPTSCPARSRATGSEQRSNCPFQQGGLKKWDDPNTWGGRVPSPNSVITLPANSKVLLGACMLQSGATYKQIVIPAGSELILADEDMAIDVGSIMVSGALSAGGPDCRLTSRITLTFHPQSGVDIYNMAIWVQKGGELDLHGKLFTPTWTRLAQTANAGVSSLQLQDPVKSWEAGQQVVITTTIWKDEQENQNEVVTVSSVSSDGRTVYLTQPLQYQHYGGPEYQAEVGLLSRYILGDASTERSKRGVHIRNEGRARIRGVQAFRAGQNNVLGAYPFHWHFAGDASGQMATDNSVYRSFYRCFTIHATNSLLLQNNVGFDAQGHCFYIEDGVEEYNTIDHNLAAYVHVIGQVLTNSWLSSSLELPAAGYDQSGQTFRESPGMPQPSDSAASGFYVTNPNNRLTNNAASGGYSGFIYPVLPKPIGPSRYTNIVPASRPMLRFDSNSAHSSGYMWFQAGCLYFGGLIYEDPKDNNRLYYNGGRHEFTTMDAAGKTPSFFQMTNTKVFLCMVGHMSWGQRFEVINYQAYDIVRGATLFGQGLLQNAYINVQSANQRSNFPGRLDDLPPIAGFQWYDTRTMTIIKDTTFVNYKYQPQLGYYRMAVFYTMTHSDEYKPMGMSSTQNISLINVDHQAIGRIDVHETGSSRMFNWLDYDGSSTQRTGPTIVGSWPNWWQIAPDCTYENEWNSWVCPWRGGQEVGRVELRIPGVTIAWDTGKAVPPTKDNEIGYVALFGYRGNQARKMAITKNEGITGVTGQTGWYAHFYSGAPKYHEIWMSQVPVGTSLVWSSRYPAGTKFEIYRTFRWYSGMSRTVNQASSLSQVVSGDGLSYYFDGHHLFVKLVDPGNQETQGIDFCRGGVCVRGYRYWSLYYSIKATNLNCGGAFCGMQDQWDDIPDALPGSSAVVRSFGGASQTSGGGNDGGSSSSSSSCTDKQPTDGTTCAQKKSWGQCSESWMKQADWCAATCGRCTPQASSATTATTPTGTCMDAQPGDGTTCAQKKLWGQCSQSWMAQAGWCALTCGRCSQPAATQGAASAGCTDVAPPGGFSCAQQKAWGKCTEAWIRDGGFCKASCGQCASSTACTDNTPAGGFSCVQQAAWGKCSEAWMSTGNYCAVSCGRCSAGVDAVAGVESVVPEEGAEPACVDVAPPGQFSCTEQQAWGMCDTLNGTAFCAATCGRCSPDAGNTLCDDIPTPDATPCAVTVADGKCSSPYVQRGGYCRASCGACQVAGSAGVQAVICDDLPTPDGVTCMEQRMSGQCNSTYLALGNYCRDTCGRCTVLEGAAPGPEPAPADGSQPPAVVAAAGGAGGRKLIPAFTRPRPAAGAPGALHTLMAHPPLEIHQHPSCKEQILALHKCHDDNPFAKYWGVCNETLAELRACFKNEKRTKIALNKAQAEKERERFLARVAARRQEQEAAKAADAAAAEVQQSGQPQYQLQAEEAAGSSAAAAEAGPPQRRPRVLLAATGSVATIKLAQLAQLLLQFADVKVIATKAALYFVEEADLPPACRPLLGDEDEWRQWRAVGDPVVHIELRRWADAFVIAPLSANTLAKAANGLCDNLVTCVVRAWDFGKPLLLAPAMNTFMWDSPFTAQHLAAVTALGATVVPPVSKRLACGDVGTGGMAAPEDIAAACRAALAAAGLLPVEVAACRPLLGRHEDEWRQWRAVGDPVVHIELRRWADAFVIAPLSANTLAKAANGLCDNLVTCVVRAWDFGKPLLLAPAMNTFMWDSPFTAQHLAAVTALGATSTSVRAVPLSCSGGTAMTSARFLVAALLLAALAVHPAAAAGRPPRRSLLAKAPTKAPIANPPMFLLFSHDDGVSSADLKAVLAVSDQHKNPNGCRVPVTWFACTRGCPFDCASAKAVYSKGHEIGDHTMDHKDLRKMSYAQIQAQVVGARSAIAACGIPAASIAGFRTPFLSDSPTVRKVLSDAGFRYDSSIGQDGGASRPWPARIAGGMPYDCDVAGNQCSASESYPSLIEVPLYGYPGGNTMDPCTNENTGAKKSGCSAYAQLKGAFDTAYNGHRGPMEISIHTPFMQDTQFAADTSKFLAYALAKPDVWAVTMSQFLDWMEAPVPASGMAAFMKKYKCDKCGRSAAGPLPPLARCMPAVLDRSPFDDLTVPARSQLLLGSAADPSSAGSGSDTTPGVTTLLSLPDSLLIEILQHVDADERHEHVALVCKRLLALTRSPELLASCCISISGGHDSLLPRLRAALAFLCSHGRHIKQLELYAEPAANPRYPAHATNELQALVGSCLAAVSAAGGQLQELEVSGQTPLVSTAWLPALSALTHLQLGGKQHALQLPAGFSKLLCLSYAHLSGKPLHLPVDGLPPSLTSLILTGASTAELSGGQASLSRLSSLRQLQLELTSGPAVELAPLAGLSALTLLGLFSSPLPGCLPRLSQLLALSIGDCKEAAALDATLAGLKQLRTLIISCSALASMPPSITALTGLQRLFFHWGGGSALDLPPGAWRSPLRWLGMDWVDILQAASDGVLAEMAQLEYLCLLNKPTSRAAAGTSWDDLWSFVTTHPPLRCLGLDIVAGSCSTVALELLDAVIDLKHRRPELQLRRVGRDDSPDFFAEVMQEEHEHVALVCKRLSALTQAPELLRHCVIDLTGSPPSVLPRLQAALRFLQTQGQHIRRLTMYVEPAASPNDSAEAIQELHALVASCLAAVGAAGGQLEKLVVGPLTPVISTACLPALTALDLIDLGTKQHELRLPAGFSRLARLTGAHMRGSPLILPPDGLPPSITNLYLGGVSTAELGGVQASLARLSSLRKLQLSGTTVGAAELAALRSLTALTYLGLYSGPLPGCLPTLSQLVSLGIGQCREEDHAALDAALGQLSQLRRLAISCGQLDGMPPSTTALTCLEHLCCISGGEGTVFLPPSSRRSSLRWLGMDWVNLLPTVAAGALAQMEQLEFICLVGNPATVPADGPEWHALWVFLASHPPLRCLGLEMYARSCPTVELELLDAVVGLKHRRPELQLRRMGRDGRPTCFLETISDACIPDGSE